MIGLNWQLGKQFSLKLPVRIWGTIPEDRDNNDSGFVYFSKHNIQTNALIQYMCKLLERNFSQCKK